MPYFRFIFLLLAVFLSCSCKVQAGPAAQDILAASDAVRNPANSFSVINTLTEYHDGKQTDASTLEIYAKPDKHSGQFLSLIRYAAPARDVNKLMLYNARDLWFFDPASKASIRVSPQQRVLGQASNGDVVTANMAQDYTAQLGGQEDVTDGDHQNRRAYKLDLQANSALVTYHRIEIWIDTGNNRPLKARFYTESERLLKTAYYRRFEHQLGMERPTETVIIDGLDPKWVTVMRNTAYVWRDIPDAWLQRDYLARFKPE